MAENSPQKSTHKSGELREEKSISSPTLESHPSLVGEILDFFRWVWNLIWTLMKDAAAFGRWCRAEPLAASILAAIALVLVYFFGIVQPFMYGSISATRWVWEAWNPEGEQSYGMIVPLIALWLFYHHRPALKAAAPGGYALGLPVWVAGILLYVIAVRSLNPRMCLASIPFLLYGGIRFAWGRAVARVLFFPCAFLLFMIPVAALEQATSNLQFIITGAVGKLAHLLGISILAVGTTLNATDGSFNFEIAEGCSGIRSLMAMTMLTAVFVHLTQDRLWKKLLIFSCSLGFAIVGNIGRIFSIVLLAKFYDPNLAAGVYHEYSSFIFFPIAILAMLFFSNILNCHLKSRRHTALRAQPPT